KMLRFAIVVLSIGAIGVAIADDSIALCTESVDDYQTATLDNEYLLDEASSTLPDCFQYHTAAIDGALCSPAIHLVPTAIARKAASLVHSAAPTVLMTMQC